MLVVLINVSNGHSNPNFSADDSKPKTIKRSKDDKRKLLSTRRRKQSHTRKRQRREEKRGKKQTNKQTSIAFNKNQTVHADVCVCSFTPSKRSNNARVRFLAVRHHNAFTNFLFLDVKVNTLRCYRTPIITEKRLYRGFVLFFAFKGEKKIADFSFLIKLIFTVSSSSCHVSLVFVWYKK